MTVTEHENKPSGIANAANMLGLITRQHDNNKIVGIHDVFDQLGIMLIP